MLIPPNLRLLTCYFDGDKLTPAVWRTTMPATKSTAVKANDAAFQASFQKVVEMFQNNLLTAHSEADKQLAADRATNGLKTAKETYDRTEAIINTVFP